MPYTRRQMAEIYGARDDEQDTLATRLAQEQQEANTRESQAIAFAKQNTNPYRSQQN